MTDHYAAAEAALHAAGELPGTPTRTELLLQALTHALLATMPPREEPAPPPTLAEQLLDIIRAGGGSWTGPRAHKALAIAGTEVERSEASAALKELEKAGYVRKGMSGSSAVVLAD